MWGPTRTFWNAGHEIGCRMSPLLERERTDTRAALRDFDGLTYVNSGDWVESCTAAVEHFDGRMEIIDWSVLSRTLNREQATAAFNWRRRAAA